MPLFDVAGLPQNLGIQGISGNLFVNQGKSRQKKYFIRGKVRKNQ